MKTSTILWLNKKKHFAEHSPLKSKVRVTERHDTHPVGGVEDQKIEIWMESDTQCQCIYYHLFDKS